MMDEQAMKEDEKMCVKCGKGTEGYKCEVCGNEGMGKDMPHVCGDEHCLVKCKDCNEAESKCTC
jgi:hypothetical protein